MEILNNLAKQFLTDVNADGKVDLADAVNAMQSLLADSSGKLDVNELLNKLKSADLSEAVATWLGDGKNALLSSDVVTNLFDAEKLNKFAASLNIDLEAAKTGLATAIPNLIDQISDGGQLKEKFNEGIALLQEEAAEVVATANTAATGILGKLKEFLNSIR